MLSTRSATAGATGGDANTGSGGLRRLWVKACVELSTVSTTGSASQRQHVFTRRRGDATADKGQ